MTNRSPDGRARARTAFYRQRRGRNLALLAILLALSALFFAITLAKLSNSQPHRPVSGIPLAIHPA